RHDRDGTLADERDGHRMGAHTLACDAARGVGGAQASGNELTVRGAVLSALKLPRSEALRATFSGPAPRPHPLALSGVETPVNLAFVEATYALECRWSSRSWSSSSMTI